MPAVNYDLMFQPLPANVLDLSPAFRNLTNGRFTPEGKGLLGALRYGDGSRLMVWSVGRNASPSAFCMSGRLLLTARLAGVALRTTPSLSLVQSGSRQCCLFRKGKAITITRLKREARRNLGGDLNC